MSAYAQIDAYPSNGWLRDEKPLCIDSRTWVGRQASVVSADPSVCRKRFWGFRPGEGLLRGPPSGEGPFTGHLALPAPPDSHVSTNAVPITMNAKPMPPRRAAPVSSSYGDFCTVSQQTAPDFDMVPGVLGGFSQPLFNTGVADLGKRWRPAAFGVDSACKTAQKSH